jgi:hypothetical protein
MLDSDSGSSPDEGSDYDTHSTGKFEVKDSKDLYDDNGFEFNEFYKDRKGFLHRRIIRQKTKTDRHINKFIEIVGDEELARESVAEVLALNKKGDTLSLAVADGKLSTYIHLMHISERVTNSCSWALGRGASESYNQSH